MADSQFSFTSNIRNLPDDLQTAGYSTEQAKAALASMPEEIASFLNSLLDGSIPITGNFTGTNNGVDGTYAVSITQYALYATNGDYALAIKQAANDNVKLIFPPGTYHIKSNLLIESKSNFKWIGIGEVIIYDDCKSVAKAAGGTTLRPNGITFKDCSNFVIDESIIFDNAVTEYAEIAEAAETNVLPTIDFINCTKYKIYGNKYAGMCGGYFSDSGNRFNTVADAPAYFMRCAFVRHWGGKQITVDNCEIVEQRAGEYICFYDCDDVEFVNCYAYDNPESNFDSFAKVIACNNVKIDGHRIESSTIGTIIEISGNNYTISDINSNTANCAYGVIAVSEQWGTLGGNSSNITVKNCRTTAGKLMGLPSLQTSPFNTTIDNLVVEDCVDAGYAVTTAATGEMNLYHVKDYTVRNKKYLNVSRFGYNETTVDYNNDYSRNATFEKCKIVASKAVYNSTVIVESYKGSFILDKCEIDLVGVNTLQLLDRYAGYASVALTNDNCSTIILKNCDIKNCIIDCRANVKFEDCTFYNVFFSSPVTLNPKIEFVNPIMTYAASPVTPQAYKIFNLLSYSELILTNPTIKGKYKTDGYAILAGAQDYAGTIRVTGGNINLIRYVNVSTDVNSDFVAATNGTLSANIYIDGVDFGTSQTVLYFTGATSPNPKRELHMKNCNLNATTSITCEGTSYDTINAVIQNNIAVGTEITDLTALAARFNSYRQSGNL